MRNLIILLLLLVGCNKETSTIQNDKEVTSIIYTTNYPLYFMAESLAGSFSEIRFPSSQSSNPGNWEPPTDTIVAMQQASLIIVNGASYEKWLDNISLPESKLINTTATLNNKLIASKEVVTHSHGAEGAHQHMGTAANTWMDLSLYLEQSQVIKMALVNQFPDHATEIENRYTELHTEITSIHNAYNAVLEQFPLQVAYSHPVYQYFKRAYGLSGPSFHMEPSEVPSDEQLHELEHAMDHQKIEIMIWEGQPLPESIEMLNKMNIKSIVIDPLDNTPTQGDFIDGMQRNLQQLQDLIGEQANS